MIKNRNLALLDGAADVFENGQKSRKQMESTLDELYQWIGRLKLERHFLEKNLSL
jgi:hypothetical protein